jgi:hypothetical protein
LPNIWFLASNTENEANFIYDIIATLHYNYAESSFPIKSCTLFAARFSGNFVTYKTVVSLTYLVEVGGPLPEKTKLQVQKFPESGPGLNILDPGDREAFIKSLVAIRTYMQRRNVTLPSKVLMRSLHYGPH